MNINERCYGYEPAASQLRQLRTDLAQARQLLREASMMTREATDLLVGDDGGLVPEGWAEFRERIDAFLIDAFLADTKDGER